MWSISEIGKAIQMGLVEEADRVEADQAVYGLDTCNEVRLQGLMALALEKAGFGVYREERYPECRAKKGSKGLRCDLVLTPDRRPLATPEKLPTFFDPPDRVALSDAFWLEVKIIAQFKTGAANRRYSSLFAAVRQDIAKLSTHTSIRHGGLLILIFAQDEVVADHDLEVWRSHCSDRGFRIGDPSLGSVPLGDRIGNTMCRVALYPVYSNEIAAPSPVATGLLTQT